MPNIKSAEKRVELTRTRTLRNAQIKSSVKTARRHFSNAVNGGAIDEARKTCLLALRMIDKAKSKGVMHPNTAARRKSRLQKQLNTLLANNN